MGFSHKAFFPFVMTFNFLKIVNTLLKLIYVLYGKLIMFYKKNLEDTEK